MLTKAVIFDYIGTLVTCKGYSMADSEAKLYSALVAEGFEMQKNKFLDAYKEAHKKYRKIRYEQYREVTNAVWVSEALCNLGIMVTAEDGQVKAALDVFFQDFIDTLELRDGAKKLLTQTQTGCKIGLISNFTFAPVIHKSLRKTHIHPYFNTIVVSDEVGWRKPAGQIFQHALTRLGVAASEAVFVGDSPLEDIKGAKDAGLQTIFVSSQFNGLKELKESKQDPTYIARDLEAVSDKLNEILSL